MDNRILTAQEQHEQESNSQSPEVGQPPIIVQNNQDGGNGLGVLAAVALVALVVLGIWWFGFGPGTGTSTPANPDTAPPAATTAPVQSAPAP